MSTLAMEDEQRRRAADGTMDSRVLDETVEMKRGNEMVLECYIHGVVLSFGCFF